MYTRNRRRVKKLIRGNIREEGFVMPVYDFTCLERNKNFTLTLPLKEYGKDKLKFPSCGSGKVEQKPAAFFAVTSRKS